MYNPNFIPDFLEMNNKVTLYFICIFQMILVLKLSYDIHMNKIFIWNQLIILFKLCLKNPTNRSHLLIQNKRKKYQEYWNIQLHFLSRYLGYFTGNSTKKWQRKVERINSTMKYWIDITKVFKNDTGFWMKVVSTFGTVLHIKSRSLFYHDMMHKLIHSFSLTMFLT